MHPTPRAQSDSPPLATCSHAHWVIAELDVRGGIDGHAAMCLSYAIGDALNAGATAIVVDLRDLIAIDAAALALCVRARADCHAAGVRLELLLSGSARHVVIARAFAGAGLGGQLEFTADPSPSAQPVHRPRPRLVRDA